MELAKEGGILVLTGRRAQGAGQVNLVFTFKKETFQFSKNIPFLLKAFCISMMTSGCQIWPNFTKFVAGTTLL